MHIKKYLRAFVMLVIAVFAVIFVFLFVSIFFVINMLIDDGAIYALNAGDMIGHLLIMFFFGRDYLLFAENLLPFKKWLILMANAVYHGHFCNADSIFCAINSDSVMLRPCKFKYP